MINGRFLDYNYSSSREKFFGVKDMFQSVMSGVINASSFGLLFVDEPLAALGSGTNRLSWEVMPSGREFNMMNRDSVWRGGGEKGRKVKMEGEQERVRGELGDVGITHSYLPVTRHCYQEHYALTLRKVYYVSSFSEYHSNTRNSRETRVEKSGNYYVSFHRQENIVSSVSFLLFLFYLFLILFPAINSTASFLQFFGGPIDLKLSKHVPLSVRQDIF